MSDFCVFWEELLGFILKNQIHFQSLNKLKLDHCFIHIVLSQLYFQTYWLAYYKGLTKYQGVLERCLSWSIFSDKELTLKTPALKSLYGGQFALSYKDYLLINQTFDAALQFSLETNPLIHEIWGAYLKF